ncbi:MAG: GTPase Era [Bacteroidetes bacterium]|nr:MAG: GTPase Era [Bacteroidota bacterium]
MSKHKAAFVNIIGNPNVGKSTLMNQFVGEKLSIITSKSQTTRHNIKGIVNGEDFQLVFSDTPGVLKPHYKLQKSMLNFSETALTDADIVVYVTDVYEKEEKNIDFLEKVKHLSIPILLVINKLDQSEQEKIIRLVSKWEGILPKAEIFPTSALNKFNVKNIFNRLLELAPESPPFFPKDQLTDKTERFFVSEIIREKILIRYKKEIPYSVEVEVEEFKEDDKIIRIRSIIYVERKSQKGIIIGHQGNAIKHVGIDARKDIEAFVGKQVYLDLSVKVSKDWRENDNQLKRFGYDG